MKIKSITDYEIFFYSTFNSHFWTVSFNSISVFNGSWMQNSGWKAIFDGTRCKRKRIKALVCQSSRCIMSGSVGMQQCQYEWVIAGQTKIKILLWSNIRCYTLRCKSAWWKVNVGRTRHLMPKKNISYGWCVV